LNPHHRALALKPSDARIAISNIGTTRGGYSATAAAAAAAFIGASNLIISERESENAFAGAIARLCVSALSYYPRIKTQIKRGRPKLN